MNRLPILTPSLSLPLTISTIYFLRVCQHFKFHPGIGQQKVIVRGVGQNLEKHMAITGVLQEILKVLLLTVRIRKSFPTQSWITSRDERRCQMGMQRLLYI